MNLTWDLSQMYQSKEAYDADLEEYKHLCAKELEFKGKLGEERRLLEYFKLQDQIDMLGEKLYAYNMFSIDLDGSDHVALERQAALENLENAQLQKTLFVDQEMKKIPSAQFIAWSQKPAFANYRLGMQHFAEDKKHILPEAQEKLLAKASEAFDANGVFDALNNVEIKYGKIKDESGNIVQLTKGNCCKYMTSCHRPTRLAATKACIKPYREHNQTIAANFISHLKYCNFVSTSSKYKNTIEQSTLGSHLPKALPKLVVKNVTSYIPLLHKYFDWRKKFMGLRTLDICDTTCELFDQKIAKTYSMPQAIPEIKAALAPLGQAYTNMLDVAANEHWIDAIERPNKQSGAYNMGIYGQHPYILMTFDGTSDSVSTLAHEFGHAMHTYYSNAAQPFATAEYGIFLAEIASTVNEILLAKYQIDHAQTREQKIEGLWHLIDGFFGTVFVQTQYTEFELYAHGAVEKGEPLTYKKLNDCFYGLVKKYYGKDIKGAQSRQYHWSRVPHFYRPFYVFKYATGFISACAIAQKVLTVPGFADTYITKFLSAGSSREACDILKGVGVDILDKSTYATAFEMLEDSINQLEQLIK